MITINGEQFSESEIGRIYDKIIELKMEEKINKEDLESFLRCLKEGTNDFKGIVIIKNDEPQNTDIQNNESEIIKEKEEPLIFSMEKRKRITKEIQEKEEPLIFSMEKRKRITEIQEKEEPLIFSLEKPKRTTEIQQQEKQEKQEKGMKQ